MLRQGSHRPRAVALLLVLLLSLPVLMAGCRRTTEVTVGKQAPDGFVYPLGDQVAVQFPRELRGTPLMLSFFSPG